MTLDDVIASLVAERFGTPMTAAPTPEIEPDDDLKTAQRRRELSAALDESDTPRSGPVFNARGVA